MARRPTRSSRKDYGDYIILDGEKVPIRRHETDFSVMAPEDAIDAPQVESTERLSNNLTRVAVATADARDRLMDDVRTERVAHHIYQMEDTGEEIIIADRVILELRREGSGELGRILEEFHLEHVGRMGGAHVLRLTDATRRNPVRLANELSERPEVVSCTPEIMLEIEFHREPALFAEQWYLTTDLISHPDILPGADIQVPEAWEISKGDPSIVVAVIDDGFDLGHPALSSTRRHPDGRDFVEADLEPLPSLSDYHGTPVASIAVGTHSSDSAMRGIAPGCTFLPVRIGFGSMGSQIDILDVFRFVSERADVVNCSFGTSPRSRDVFSRHFRGEITRLAETGGRRGKGLVFVFSAANDDAPTFLEADQNVNGVLFTNSRRGISEIPAGRRVFSGYPMTEGVVVVAAMSSLKRKSGYSCWGPHITVTAPSNNMHYIASFVRAGSDERRELFVADYRGRGQVAASNRPGHGAPFSRIRSIDDPSTPELEEHVYTRRFGGTSGAAPVVAGVAGLMLSVNPDLSAQDVRNILMSTADTDLDPVLDLADDPNVQGLSGAFVNGRSLWFGSGKVNAFRAVSRARALGNAGGGGGITPPSGPVEIFREVAPGLDIPDFRPEGVVSHIEIETPGRLADIEISCDITHTWRGDLVVMIITPEGFPADLHRMRGGGARDLRQTFTPSDTPGLADLVQGAVDVHGRWTLHVSDNLRRDVGRLNRWSLKIRTA